MRPVTLSRALKDAVAPPYPTPQENLNLGDTPRPASKGLGPSVLPIFQQPVGGQLQSVPHSRERGQALLLLVVAMTIVFVTGAIAVDVGLWLSERRGAQTDADFPALAGAWELIDPTGNNTPQAIGAVNDWIGDNDEQGNLTLHNVVVDNSCFGVWDEDAVSVDVRHDSRTLFFSIFGFADEPNIGAHAKACAGAAQGLGNIVPFQIDNDPGPCFDTQEQPILTAFCPLELGAQGGNPRGMIDLEDQSGGGHCSQAGGSADIADLIEFGAPGNCLINGGNNCSPARNGPWDECVAMQPGNPQNVLDGTHRRLLRDGLCDATYGQDGDGIDDFDETVQAIPGTGGGPNTLYEPRDCDPVTEGTQISSRIITIVVLEHRPPPNAGNRGFPILAFAGFYLSGCTPEGMAVNSQDDTDPYCNTPPPPGFGTGHSVVWGQFMKLILSGGGVGEPNDSTTVFGISLVE